MFLRRLSLCAGPQPSPMLCVRIDTLGTVAPAAWSHGQRRRYLSRPITAVGGDDKSMRDCNQERGITSHWPRSVSVRALQTPLRVEPRLKEFTNHNAPQTFWGRCAGQERYHRWSHTEPCSSVGTRTM